jgi:hypothetical protein
VRNKQNHAICVESNQQLNNRVGGIFNKVSRHACDTRYLGFLVPRCGLLRLNASPLSIMENNHDFAAAPDVDTSGIFCDKFSASPGAAP